MNANAQEVVEETTGTENVEAAVTTNGDLGVDTLDSFVDITETETVETIEEAAVVETTPLTTSGDDSLESFVDITAGPADVSLDVVVAGDVVTPSATQAPPVARLTFAERAVDMGLTVLPGGTYYYSDRFSEVAYKVTKTLEGSGIMDDTEIPHLSIYTKGIAPTATWKYQHPISDSYKFEGNAAMIDRIKASIMAVGNATIEEKSYVAGNNAEIRHELIIMNGTTIPEVGSILPMMQIINSYNGVKASIISFGLAILEPNNVMSSFATDKFGKIKQIHLSGSPTELSAALGEYVTIFNANIMQVVTDNFARPVTPEEMLGLLDKIESKAGKKRREEIAVVLPNTADATAVAAWNLNAWQLFLALTRFTSVEKNISSKKILESVVESVLVLPAQMMAALKTING